MSSMKGKDFRKERMDRSREFFEERERLLTSRKKAKQKNILAINQKTGVDFSALSKTLVELRESFGYTQRFVAASLNIAYQSYQAYECAKTLPSLTNFVKLADLYDVSLDYLLGRKEI